MDHPATFEMPVDDNFAPAISIRATPSDYEITSELPKVRSENISVRFINGVLIVTARVEKEVFQNLSKVLIVDRQYGHVEQGFALPADADPEGISADYDNGVLKVLISRLPATC